MMKARVLVRLKTEVSDPAGAAIREALATLNYTAISGVRVGKVFDLELAGSDPIRARAEVEKIAHEILSNPVIEDFTVDLFEGDRS